MRLLTPRSQLGPPRASDVHRHERRAYGTQCAACGTRIQFGQGMQHSITISHASRRPLHNPRCAACRSGTYFNAWDSKAGFTGSRRRCRGHGLWARASTSSPCPCAMRCDLSRCPSRCAPLLPSGPQSRQRSARLWRAHRGCPGTWRTASRGRSSRFSTARQALWAPPCAASYSAPAEASHGLGQQPSICTCSPHAQPWPPLGPSAALVCVVCSSM